MSLSAHGTLAMTVMHPQCFSQLTESTSHVTMPVARDKSPDVARFVGTRKAGL
jgi:hypothetical protein